MEISQSTPKNLRIRKVHFLIIMLYAFLLIFPFLLRLADPTAPEKLFPPFYLVALWGLTIISLFYIRNPFSLLVVALWMAWFVVGSINIIAAYEFYGSYYLLETSKAGIVYVIFTFIFSLGILLYERFIKPIFRTIDKNRLIYQGNIFKRINPIFAFIFLIFPFLWFIDLYRSLGYIPILLGFRNIDLTNEIYSLNYGPLYGFSILNVLGMLIVLDRLRTKPPMRWIYLVLLAVFAFFSVSTGKRFAILLFLISGMVYIFRTYRIRIIHIVIIGILGLGLYLGLLVLRQGLDTERYSSIAGKFVITGVEYRTFAYVVDHYQPETIKNYSWGASALAAMVNSQITNLFGIDKVNLVHQGSAYSWGYIFETDFGIRTGIISELYMAYGYRGLGIILVIGLLVGWVSDHIKSTTSKNSLVFLTVIYGLFLMAIVGQTTDTTGGIIVIFYAWFVLYAIKLMNVNIAIK